MASLPTWTATTTGADVAATFSSSILNKTILIVGVSPNSIGEATAAAFAAHSPKLLILASRTLSNLETVAATLPESCPVKLVTVDLSDYSSVRHAAQQIKALTEVIDIQINLAAVVTQEHTLSATAKHEMQLATTFLGPWLLTNLLLPLHLKAAAFSTTNGNSVPTRIVNVTSGGHVLSPVRFSDPHFHLPLPALPVSERPAPHFPPAILPKDPERDPYSVWLAYGQAKTANVLFSVELNKRLLAKGHGVASLAVHPGSIETNLSRDLNEESRKIVEGTTAKTGWMDLGRGCAGCVFAGVDSRVVDGDGKTLAGKGKGKGVYINVYRVDDEAVAEHAVDEESARRLWELAEREVGVVCDGLGSVVERKVEGSKI